MIALFLLALGAVTIATAAVQALAALADYITHRDPG